MLKALIIDDEKDARDALTVLLSKFVDGVEVIGDAGGVEAGLRAIETLQPQLVFLDINMEDGTGFDLLDQLEHCNFHLIFVTAFNQYAIKAFKYAAVDYLLKPVDLQELRKCVERIRVLTSHEHTEDRVHHLKTIKAKGANSKLALPSMDGYDIVDVYDVIRCEGQKNYTTFFLKGGKRIVVSKTLKEYEYLLSEHNFLRVYQSHLVNLGCITKYMKGRGGSLVMEDGSTIPVSREKKEELLSRLK